jgi:hypothetical protein
MIRPGRKNSQTVLKLSRSLDRTDYLPLRATSCNVHYIVDRYYMTMKVMKERLGASLTIFRPGWIRAGWMWTQLHFRPALHGSTLGFGTKWVIKRVIMHLALYSACRLAKSIRFRSYDGGAAVVPRGVVHQLPLQAIPAVIGSRFLLRYGPLAFAGP